MAPTTLTLNVAERIAKAEAKVAAARVDLAQAEAELRVYKDLEREVYGSTERPAPRSAAHLVSKGFWPTPNPADDQPHPTGKRERRPVTKWLTAMEPLLERPLTLDEWAPLAQQQGIDKRSLGDQVRRYVNAVGFLTQSSDGRLHLTARARRYVEEFKGQQL